MNTVTKKLATVTAAVIFSMTAISTVIPAHAQDAPVTTPTAPTTNTNKPHLAFHLARQCWDALMDSASKALGLSAADIRQMMAQDNLSLKGVVESKGGNASEIENAGKAKVRAAIDQALADGTITRKQADKLKENVDSVTDREYNRVPHHHKDTKATPTAAQ